MRIKGVFLLKEDMRLLDLIGNTPMVNIDNVFNIKENISIFAKAEWTNPGGSLKDRPVKRMLTHAIKNNTLTKDKIIIDSSSGNAGIAYSMIGNALGYNVNIVIPENASKERKERILSHGASIIETDAIEGYDEALRHAHRLVEKSPGKYFLCDQYSNDNNWKSHYDGTASEMLEQIKGSIDYFVGGIGTGGSITGIGRKLKEIYPNVKIIAVRPEVWPGIEGLKPLGQEHDIIPKILDMSIIDQWIDITADESKIWAHKLAKKGFFVGQSTGSYVSAISRILPDIQSGNIVTLFNDVGERYFSAGLWS